MAEAAGAGDAEVLRRHAHTLEVECGELRRDRALRALCGARGAGTGRRPRRCRRGGEPHRPGVRRSARRTRDARMNAMSTTPATVLVVDDDPLNRADAVDVARRRGPPGARGRQRPRSHRRARRARDRRRPHRHRDAGDGRLRAARAPQRRRPPEDHPVHRHLRRRRDGLDRRLHQARRRGLPAEAVRSGAAPRPPRGVPRQEADDRRAARVEHAPQPSGSTRRCARWSGSTGCGASSPRSSPRRSPPAASRSSPATAARSPCCSATCAASPRSPRRPSPKR